MNIEEKLGQLFFIGFNGYVLNNELKKIIKTIQPGGIILFESNIESKNQVKKLIEEINSLVKIKPFIGVDQEGGAVERLRNISTSLPSAWGLGKLESSDVKKINEIIISDLKELGFNLNFAPVLDINSNYENPIIGSRSFGENEKIVSKYGIETLKTYLKSNIIPVVKHFPGHGDLDIDSHLDLPTLLKNKNELLNFELIPFTEAIKNKAPIIMLGHIQLPKIESDKKKPASLSKKTIDFLREDLNFNGLTITDDLNMKGISKNYSIEDAAYIAILAGVNLLLFNFEEESALNAFNFLKKEIKRNEPLRNKTEKSYEKILSLKEKSIFLGNKKTLKIRDKEKISYETTKKIVHFVKRDIFFKHIDKNEPVDIIYPITHRFRKEDLKNIAKELKLKNINLINYPIDPSPKDISEIVKGSIKFDRQILIVYDIPARKKQKKLAEALLKLNSNLIVISVGLEYDIEYLPFIKNYLVSYAPNYVSLLCAFECMINPTNY